jgi:hypothetical protein
VEPSLHGEIALEKDIKSVAESPAIYETIFRKIKGCAAFVGDLSFVGQSLPEIPEPSKTPRFDSESKRGEPTTWA